MNTLRRACIAHTTISTTAVDLDYITLKRGEATRLVQRLWRIAGTLASAPGVHLPLSAPAPKDTYITRIHYTHALHAYIAHIVYAHELFFALAS